MSWICRQTNDNNNQINFDAFFLNLLELNSMTFNFKTLRNINFITSLTIAKIVYTTVIKCYKLEVSKIFNSDDFRKMFY